MINDRAFGRLILSLGLMLSTGAHAQTWPTKPIRLVSPWSPGGPAEALARVVTTKMSEALGQPFVIDSRGGANGTIDAAIVAKAAPDGYTVLFSHLGPMAIAPALMKEIPYDSVRDFEAVTQVVSGPTLLVVRNDVPARNLKELIDHAKANPGKVRALAISTLQRSPNFPDIPSVSETLSGFELNSWYGIMVPAGTPRAIVSRLHHETAVALKKPDVLEWLKQNGLDARGTSPEEHVIYLKAELVKWAGIVKAAKVRTE